MSNGADRPEPAGRPAVSPETLMRMATYYLARHAASEKHLREILARKVRRRCERRDLPVPEPATLAAMLDAVGERLRAAGLVDDRLYAHGRAASLAAKGRPAWRIRTELKRQGIDPDAGDLAEAARPDDAAQAAIFARRRRLGPHRLGARAENRDRDLAALARAGFPLAVARAVVDGEADA